MVSKIKSLEDKFKEMVGGLLEENRALRRRLARYEGREARPEEGQSLGEPSSMLSEESSIYSESARRFLTNIYECPPDLQKYFKGPAPQCRLVPQCHDQVLKGFSLAFFKFVAVVHKERDQAVFRELLGLCEMKYDQYQDSTIPERYHYLYNNQILKSAILSMVRALGEIRTDEAFFEIVQEYPVYEFLSMVFLKTACLVSEGIEGCSAALSFFEPLPVEHLINTLAALFGLEVST